MDAFFSVAPFWISANNWDRAFGGAAFVCSIGGGGGGGGGANPFETESILSNFGQQINTKNWRCNWSIWFWCHRLFGIRLFGTHNGIKIRFDGSLNLFYYCAISVAVIFYCKSKIFNKNATPSTLSKAMIKWTFDYLQRTSRSVKWIINHVDTSP